MAAAGQWWPCWCCRLSKPHFTLHIVACHGAYLYVFIANKACEDTPCARPDSGPEHAVQHTPESVGIKIRLVRQQPAARSRYNGSTTAACKHTYHRSRHRCTIEHATAMASTAARTQTTTVTAKTPASLPTSPAPLAAPSWPLEGRCRGCDRIRRAEAAEMGWSVKGKGRRGAKTGLDQVEGELNRKESHKSEKHLCITLLDLLCLSSPFAVAVVSPLRGPWSLVHWSVLGSWPTPLADDQVPFGSRCRLMDPLISGAVDLTPSQHL